MSVAAAIGCCAIRAAAAKSRQVGTRNLAIAQWLVEKYDLTEEDACAGGNFALREACEMGFLNVAQWLMKRFDLSETISRADKY
jgi:hypothetical protein